MVVIALVLLGAVLLVGGGWSLASTFESPAQREARVRPPSPEPITARVESGVLEKTITLRGNVQRGAPQTVHFPALGASTAVVTRAPLGPGAVVTSGSVVSEVNGRPTIAISGAFAFYRSLRRGDAGPDVRQLQAGLRDAGFQVRTDGVFGAGTERAIRALYRRAGYDAPTAAPDDAPTIPAPAGPDAGPAPAKATDPAVVLDTGEIVVADLPAHLVSTPGVGSVVTDASTIELQHGAAGVVASVPPLLAEQLAGSPTGAITTQKGTVEVVVANVGKPTGDSDEVPVLLDAVDAAALEPLLGEDGAVTLRTKLVADRALIVPTTAVGTGGHGAAHVLVRTGDGSFRRVAVTELGQLDGRSAIEAIRARRIHVGDDVRVD